MNAVFRLLALSLLCLFIAPVALAESVDDDDDAVPYAIDAATWPEFSDTYDAAACNQVANPRSACNRGGESLTSFVANFNKSKAFRLKRIDPGIPDCFRDFFTQPWWKTGKLYKVIPSRPTKKSGYSLRTWQFVTADSAWFIGGYMPPFDDDDVGLGLFMHFERRGGKWYLTQTMVI